MISVLLQDVGSYKGDIINVVAGKLVDSFPVSIRVVVSNWEIPPPSDALNLYRMQLRADTVNKYIYDIHRGFIEEGGYVVGVVDGDGYVEGLNFVFGLATPNLRVASVYTLRLRSKDVNLYIERLSKEVAHELGHLLGLSHCSDKRCVMSFSNTLGEVDYKKLWFCPKCTIKLKSIVQRGL